jgi:hypothetical protein
MCEAQTNLLKIGFFILIVVNIVFYISSHTICIECLCFGSKLKRV